MNEIGCISADDLEQGKPGHVTKEIATSYWNLCSAVYAYVFGNLASLGIDVAGESQLVGYPTQFPSVSMVDWNTGAPNARFRVLQLLKSNFGPGDKIVSSVNPSPYVYSLAFLCKDGQRKLLLVNKRDRNIEIGVSEHIKGGESSLQLRGYEVAVLTLE